MIEFVATEREAVAIASARIWAMMSPKLSPARVAEFNAAWERMAAIPSRRWTLSLLFSGDSANRTVLGSCPATWVLDSLESANAWR